MDKIPKVEKGYTYEVAVSFAGEQRDYVEEVVECLKAKGISCFYDADEESEIDMWGKNLIEHFHSVFSKVSRFCVMFISSDYAEKQWTKLERRAALERAMKQDEEYVLPVRFDDTELPGLPSTTKYLDLRQISPKELAERIDSKLNLMSELSPNSKLLRQSIDTKTEEWLGEVSVILLPLKAYIFEVEDRQNNPGLNQICYTFEMACDDIQEHLRYSSTDKYTSDLLELARIAESIATFDFYLGRECWDRFKSKLSKADSSITEILSTPDFQAVMIVDEVVELDNILSGLISELDIVTCAIADLNPLQVHKRLPHYQAQISSIGVRLYKLSWFYEYNGVKSIVNIVREEAVALHLLEATDCFMHTGDILEFTQSLPTRLAILRSIE